MYLWVKLTYDNLTRDSGDRTIPEGRGVRVLVSRNVPKGYKQLDYPYYTSSKTKIKKERL